MQRVREQVEVTGEREGLDGSGVTVAVLDTGVCLHKDLQGRILEFQDFVGDRGMLYVAAFYSIVL